MSVNNLAPERHFHHILQVEATTLESHPGSGSGEMASSRILEKLGGQKCLEAIITATVHKRGLGPSWALGMQGELERHRGGSTQMIFKETLV